MPNYGRYLNVTCGGSSWEVDGVGESANTALRLRFDIKLFGMQTLNLATVRVTNLLPATAYALVKANDTPITIDAGYQDNHGVLFAGYMKQATYGRENPTDTLLTLYANESDLEHNFGVINVTLPPGSTPQDQVNAAIKAMAAQSKGLPFQLGYVDPAIDLTQPKYPKSVTLFGPARDVLANIARSKQANVSYQQGDVNFLGYGNGITGGAVILNTNTGLIGMPTQEVGGVMARSLINPNIKIGHQVYIAQSLVQLAQNPLQPSGDLAPYTLPDVAADGLYTVLGLTMQGDTRGNPWYEDLVCISSAQVASYLSGNAANEPPLPPGLAPAFGTIIGN